jgi:vancomycin resistance protein YoaR
MTWDKRPPRDQAKSSSAWDGPGWWDEPAPAPKAAPKAPPAVAPRPAPVAPTIRSASPASSLRGSAPARPAARPLAGSPAPAAKAASGAPAAGRFSLGAGLLQARRKAPRTRHRPITAAMPDSVRLALGFTLGAFGALFLASALALGVSAANDGKIMPGVHAGSVDLSGLTSEEAVAKLNSAYAGLGQGNISVTTPGGTGTISYADAGRGPDSVAMAAVAMAVGRGDPLTGTASALRSFAGGTEIPVIVKVDPVALQTKIREVGTAGMTPAKDAGVDTSSAEYAVIPSVTGTGIDEAAIAKDLLEKLTNPDAGSQIAVSADFVTLQPYVTDEQAQAAIDASKKMLVDVTLSHQDAATQEQKTWDVPSAQVGAWIIFGFRTDGTFGPVVDPTPVRGFLTTIAPELEVKAVEPRVTYDKKTGNPTGVTGGQAGQAMDYDGTFVALASYLDGLANGGLPSSASIPVAVRAVNPKLAEGSDLKGFTMVGSWKVTYYRSESNGFGANIEVPAGLLNGQVIASGEQFSFLNAVGPIDEAHGYTKGGVITGGATNRQGAMGGGICSASTTVFNAAARAGLQLDERHAHFYYVDRYPLGLDATVYSNGVRVWDMRFTNDTTFPIVIKSWISGSSVTRAINVQLWSLPNGRSVKWSTPVITDKVEPTDTTRYTASLYKGQAQYRQEYPTEGFKAYLTRTVTDPTGAVLHYDEFYSVYAKVDGLLYIAGTAPPSETPSPSGGTPTPTPSGGTPTPTPTPAPTATPTPAPTATPTPPPTSGG